MKHIKQFLIIAALSALTLTLHAQTAPVSALPPASAQPPLPTSGSFLSTAQDYFTSFNTNLDSTFALQRGEVAIGVDSIQGGGVNLANSVRVSYNVYKLVSLESVTRDSGISGVFVSEQFGPALNFVIHDAKLSLYADAGYHFEKLAGQKRTFAEVGARVQKALSEHTFAGIGIGIQVPDKVRTFSAFTGFTF